MVLEALRGPTVTLTRAGVAVTDPWWPENLPSAAHCQLPFDGTVTLGVIRLPQVPGPLACSAVIGRLGQVLDWQPLVVDGEQAQLDVDSALGAFYDIADTDVLEPLFRDDEYMFEVQQRAFAEKVVAIEVEDRVVAVVFECGMGDGSYPVYVGYDVDSVAVAVLVDLELLHRAESRSA